MAAGAAGAAPPRIRLAPLKLSESYKEGQKFSPDSDEGFQKVIKMATRLLRAIEEVSNCMRGIDTAVTTHLSTDGGGTLSEGADAIRKELQVANGSRQVSEICIEELFGVTTGGKAPEGGLVGLTLKEAKEAAFAAELQAEELDDQVRFLGEECDRLESQVDGGRREKEDALRASNEHWGQLNGRLRSRKALSDLIAAKLQEELIRLKRCQ